MFKLRAKIRDEAKPKVGLYFMYGGVLYKIIDINSSGDIRLAWYSEGSGSVTGTQTFVDAKAWINAVIDAKYVIVDPWSGGVKIPQILLEYEI